jgi:hypothetical protein
VDALNDTAQGIAPTWGPISHGYLDPPTKVAFQRFYSKVDDRSFLSELLSFSQTYTYVITKFKERENVNKGVYHPELWDQYVNLKERIQLICNAKGIRFTTFFQPVIVTGKKLTPQEIGNNETNMRIPEFAEVFRQTYLAGETKALNSKVLRFISLKEAFSDVAETIYIDGQHYNPRGNEILAQKIFHEEIASLLKKSILPGSSKS